MILIHWETLIYDMNGISSKTGFQYNMDSYSIFP